MSLLEKLRQDVEGAKLLKDWFGDGGVPVSQIHSEHRADACVHGNGGQPCSLNRAANWWNLHENAKNAVAQTIRSELELKNHLSLHVSSEDELHLCAACGCCLKLLVWTPAWRLKEHTTPEQLAMMPSFCWKKKEIEA